MVALVPAPGQLPLIQFVESDDLYLQDQPDVLWFDVLPNLDYRRFRQTAARYYERLWQFNQQQARQRNERRQNSPAPNLETQTQATQRLIFSRPTLDQEADVLHQPGELPAPEIFVAPESLHPGIVPSRFAGRPPKCFFALLKSFLGMMFVGQPPEPEFVDQKLRENPAFARTCGFTIPQSGKPIRQTDIPSLRKLQQFDQIMADNQLWAELALDQVADNLRNGTLQAESTVVHDTTHYHAYSTMKVVDLDSPKAKAATEAATHPPTEAPASGESPTSQPLPRVTVGGPTVAVGRVAVVRVPLDTLDEETQQAYWENKRAEAGETQATQTQSAQAPSNGNAPQTNTKKARKPPKKKKQRKSHPRTTKNCRCSDREHCDHAWINADAGAGTVVKSTGKMYWAHKASTLSFADQEVLLDAVALNDAASHDSQSLVPHLSRLLSRHPDLKDVVTRVLDDGAADDPALKSEIQTAFGIELLAPINPRRRGPIRDDMPRGIDHLTPRGVPVCQAGFPFELLGFRQSTERFIFTAPQATPGESVCLGCALRGDCYRGESGGRRVTIAADRLPWLDRDFPQLSKRFSKAMARRTGIERIHKLMKFDHGDDRLTKRGTSSFQARLDKTLLAMHVLLAHEG
jgi:hypothetical protein